MGAKNRKRLRAIEEAKPWRYCEKCGCPVREGDACKGCEILNRPMPEWIRKP